MKDYLFCFGFGYSARALAARLDPERWRIAGTRRSEEKCEEIRESGYESVLFDENHPLDAGVLDGVTHLLISASPGEEGDPVLNAHRDMLAQIADRFSWVGYLSTTSVYGNRDGGWVDETSELKPSMARSQRRVLAEKAWLRLYREHGLPVHLFRLAGIYGPGRNQLVALKSGKKKKMIIKDGQVFSRIHVADIAGVLEASIASPNPGQVYNVCDDLPAPPQEVTAYAAELVGMQPPPAVPFETAELTAMARSFYSDSKRVSNRRVKTELGYEFLYPNYKAGFGSLLDEVK